MHSPTQLPQSEVRKKNVPTKINAAPSRAPVVSGKMFESTRVGNLWICKSFKFNRERSPTARCRKLHCFWLGTLSQNSHTQKGLNFHQRTFWLSKSTRHFFYKQNINKYNFYKSLSNKKYHPLLPWSLETATFIGDSFLLHVSLTPGKIHVEPTNQPIETENNHPNIHFWVPG